MSFLPPTVLAPPPPTESGPGLFEGLLSLGQAGSVLTSGGAAGAAGGLLSNGGGGFFQNVLGLGGQTLSFLDTREANKGAVAAEKLRAQREFQLEQQRISSSRQTAVPSVAPFPIAGRGFQEVKPTLLSTPIVLGAVGLVVVLVLVMTMRR